MMDAAEVARGLREEARGRPFMRGWFLAAADVVDALANERDGLRKAYNLQLKGMESQAELMHDLKQEVRRLAAAAHAPPLIDTP